MRASWPLDAAKASTEPRTGPIHGVQPKLKPSPSRKAESNSFLCLFAPKSIVFCFSKKLKWKTSIWWRPRIMISAPIKYRNQLVYMIWPSRPAPKPIMRKITEIPAIKHKVFTRPCQRIFFPKIWMDFSCSLPSKTPIYTGSKGKTQGEKKERIPARKTVKEKTIWFIKHSVYWYATTSITFQLLN